MECVGHEAKRFAIPAADGCLQLKNTSRGALAMCVSLSSVIAVVRFFFRLTWFEL